MPRSPARSPGTTGCTALAAGPAHGPLGTTQPVARGPARRRHGRGAAGGRPGPRGRRHQPRGGHRRVAARRPPLAPPGPRGRGDSGGAGAAAGRRGGGALARRGADGQRRLRHPPAPHRRHALRRGALPGRAASPPARQRGRREREGRRAARARGRRAGRRRRAPVWRRACRPRRLRARVRRGRPGDGHLRVVSRLHRVVAGG